MSVKVLDSIDNEVNLSAEQSRILLESFNSAGDPRVSGCPQCNSCVVASEPFMNLLDELSTSYIQEIDIFRELTELAENSPTVHLYIWEDNDCVHVLWRDPIAFEWSSVTGEKRLHH